MIDQIGGWSTAGVGQRYGEGYGLSTVRIVMEKLKSATFNGVADLNLIKKIGS